MLLWPSKELSVQWERHECKTVNLSYNESSLDVLSACVAHLILSVT
jgi:hypothetical protein